MIAVVIITTIQIIKTISAKNMKSILAKETMVLKKKDMAAMMEITQSIMQ